MDNDTKFRTEGHLGGYIIGGDEATFYPDLWDWFVDAQGVKSVVDVGCGEGHALSHFRHRDCRVAGYDGIEQDDPDIYQVDYTQGSGDLYASGRNDWDLAWCCEFVEHVEQRYMPNYLRVFRCASMVALTHAEPGQNGYHHVNCQPWQYWDGVMAAIGFTLDWNLTGVSREVSERNASPWNHYARSGLIFRRNDDRS